MRTVYARYSVCRSWPSSTTSPGDWIAAWRRYVYRVYPICYETFRRWMAVDIQVAAQKVVTAKSKPLRYREKTLFEP